MKNIWIASLLLIIAIGSVAWGFVVLYHHQEQLSQIQTTSVEEYVTFDDLGATKEDESKMTQEVHPVTILFAGDMNFDRHIRQKARQNGYDDILVGVRDVMRESDCAFANLEGPVTENASVSEGSAFGSAQNYQFTFDPQVVNVLKNTNICAVNIGNNHINNFGNEGIQSTKKFLEEKGIAYVGDTGLSGEKRFDILHIGGIAIGVVNYNAFVPDAREHAFADLATVKNESDFVVVYTHWGVEYATQSRNVERGIAHALIDAGGDVIIGSHPHVVQDSEKYNGKEIYYSLGNFVFDQYFRPETQKGLMVGVTFDKEHDTMTFREHTVCMKNTGQTVMCDAK
jgi:poly-gamma-glutamate synthesis protein (capsule biosynthesis protein)